MEVIKIVFLLFPKVHLIDLSGPAQVFYEAGQMGKVKFKIIFCSTDESIVTEQGLVLGKLTPLQDIELKARDMVCLPGLDFKSFENGEFDTHIEKASSWIRSMYQKGVYISSICSGSLLLAKIGLLDHVKCATHWKCLDYAKLNFPKAGFQDDRLYVFDKGIFTSAGMTSGIDMCLALIENWTNPLLAAKVAQEMVISVRRAETQNQKNTFLDFKNHFNEDVYRAQQILENNMESTFTIHDLAKKLNIGERQLSRLFRQHTKLTIQGYRDRLRIDFGRQLLLNTEMSVKEIAAKCGYQSTRQFSRMWKKLEDVNPIEMRKTIKGDWSPS